MQDVSAKALVTWWVTLGVLGAIMFGIVLYYIPGVGARPTMSISHSQIVATASAPSQTTARPAVSAPAAAAAPYSAPARQPTSAVAPPYNPADVVDLHLVMDDQKPLEIAPNTYFQAWTFNDTVPGPVMRVKQGATVNVTLLNEGRLLHSLDFHSAKTPISNYRNVPPGESFSWSFVARVPGVYLYHCGTTPALQHIGNGMYGVMIVDPDPPLPAADREYVLLQSEFYYGDRLPNGVITGDFGKMQRIDSDVVAFNGHQSQYRDYPLVADPGELVRLYMVDAGPTLDSSFHVVGEIFDKIYANGNPAPGNVTTGVQTGLVPVGGGAIFEVQPETAGDYLFVSHAFAQANKGAVGVLRVGHADDVGGNVDH